MPRIVTNIIAGVLLVFMFTIAVASMSRDAITMDEIAHLPAGYSYLTERDMRLNPEHPPLIKDLAAIPLLFLPINTATDSTDWQEEFNGQWQFGFKLFYERGNDPDQMIFWGRIPMVLLLVLFAILIFRWARERYGDHTALLVLFFVTFSPTFLAHSRLVTTDVAAAFAFFIGIYYFVRALQNPNRWNVITAGLAFGIAELLKFSLILLVPFLGLLAVIWWLAGKSFWQTAKVTVATFVIGFLLIYPVYAFHTAQYPAERQLADTIQGLSTQGSGKSTVAEACGNFDIAHLERCPSELTIWMAEQPILRPYAQYFYGLLLVIQRASAGHTLYFKGEVSNLGWPDYFPTVYGIKVPLAFHILTLIALLFATSKLVRAATQRKWFTRTRKWVGDHFPEVAMGLFIVMYWAVSLRSPLNLGVRHLLPVFPFTILLVASQIQELKAKKKWLAIPVTLLLLWQAVSVVSVYPSFLAYFNELAGGPSEGHKITVDSNLDWGQESRRFADWVIEQDIDTIYVDYFGGGKPDYYLGDRYESWWGTRDPAELPPNSYLALSASRLEFGKGVPVRGFDREPTEYYLWLKDKEPIHVVGHSIFVFKID